MSQKLQPVRGTHDILPEEFEKFHAVVSRARELAALYGFQEMATPIFEATDVFARSLGETSDIVHKEMFTFETKGGESITLRPEFTAGIARAFISNGLQQHLPLKLFSTGPLFRYERPQKGRQRQFHQVNFEWLGDGSASIDMEVIMLAGHLLYSLSGKNSCRLLINTLGDAESRVKYRDALIEYLQPYANDLSEDSQRRLQSNPLRILDSKSPQDQRVILDAPKITSYLSSDAGNRFDEICKALTQQGIPFFQSVEVTPSLVRGLDYYTDTVFEFVSDSNEMGAQNTVLAGGRYDGLIETMGGKPTPAIGFAAGIERLILLMQAYRVSFDRVEDVKILLLPLEKIHKKLVLWIASLFRVELGNLMNSSISKRKGIVDILWQGSLKKRMERAVKQGATYVIILGPEEVKRDVILIRDMESRTETEVQNTTSGIDSYIAQHIKPRF
jgi:histidyl-tRNA synthetase